MTFQIAQFAANVDLPEDVRASLPTEDLQTLFRGLINDRLLEGLTDANAYLPAYRALEKAGFKYDEAKKCWVEKDSPSLSAVHVDRPLGSDGKEEPTELPYGTDLTDADFQKGGPGSGCHGDNCGRPVGSLSSEDKKELSRLQKVHDQLKGHSGREQYGSSASARGNFKAQLQEWGAQVQTFYAKHESKFDEARKNSIRNDIESGDRYVNSNRELRVDMAYSYYHSALRAIGDAFGSKWVGKAADSDLEKAKDDDDVEWITVNGTHIPIGGRDAKRSETAKANYNPVTLEKTRIADKSEADLARGLELNRTGNNRPFDLVKGKIAVEVKTLIDAKTAKITMRRECRLRKLEFAKANKMRMYTIVIDKRVGGRGSFYFSAGVGSFRIGSMRAVASMKELKGLLR